MAWLLQLVNAYSLYTDDATVKVFDFEVSDHGFDASGEYSVSEMTNRTDKFGTV